MILNSVTCPMIAQQYHAVLAGSLPWSSLETAVIIQKVNVDDPRVPVRFPFYLLGKY